MAGLPVVVTDDPIRRWIAGEQDFFVDAYVAALRQALDTCPRGDAEHLTHFGWPSVASAYATFFQTVRAAEHPLPPRVLALPRLLLTMLIHKCALAARVAARRLRKGL